MFRRLALILFLALTSVWLTQAAEVLSLKLLNGSTLEGEYVNSNGRGVVLVRKDGSFTDRVNWEQFTQEALKELTKISEAEPHASSLVEDDFDEEPIPTDPKVTLKPVPRLERPDPKAGLGSLFSSPLSIVVLLIVYGANLFAAYAIAHYRNYHPIMVCSIAAVAPIIGPAIFISLPTYVPEEEEEFEEEAPAMEPLQTQATSPMIPDPAGPAASSSAAGPAGPTIYKRPQTTFNRRFFETKMAGFLRVVPSEEEKDLVICVVSARGNYVGTRIVRIQASDMTLLVKKGEASNEVVLPFGEIKEVQVRQKDTAES